MAIETQEESKTRSTVVEECKRQLLEEELSKIEVENLLNFLHMQLSYKEYKLVCRKYEQKDLWSTVIKSKPLVGNRNRHLSLP